MKRLIVDSKKLSDKILNLLASHYPYGYDDDNIIKFVLTSGEIVEAIELRSEDTIYLIKVGSKLPQIIKENIKNNLVSIMISSCGFSWNYNRILKNIKL